MACSVFIATSLDGFIARLDGSLDWLPASGGEDFGYAAFMASVDCLIMGRVTFEKVLSFGAWPYADKAVVVLSHSAPVVPLKLASSVRWKSGSPSDVLMELTAEGYRHFYVDGGRTIQGFLAAGLITKLIITRVPILLGSGIPLFGNLPHDVRLRHLGTRTFENGLVQSEYDVIG